MGLFRKGINPAKHEKREQSKRDASVKRMDDALLSYRLGKSSKEQAQAKINKEHRDKHR